MKKFSLLVAVSAGVFCAVADPIDVSGIDLDSKKIDRTGVTVTESNPRSDKNYGSSYLLDGGLEDNQRWISAAKKCNLVFTFPEATMVNAIGVQAANYAGGGRAPKAWTFYGSNDDGASWVALDTQESQTGWSSKQLKVYSFKNTTAYTKYKFDISDNNGDSVSSLSEFWFYDIQVSRLFVESSLGQTFGTVTPKWGTTVQSPGEEVAISAYDTWDRDDDGLFVVSCTGYDRYDTNASGDFEYTSSGEGSSLTIPKFPELDVKIVWKLSVSVGVTVSAENGAVTGVGSYGLGDVVTLQAIPNEGYYFLHWTDLPEGVDPTSDIVRFTVTDKVVATAVFAPFAGHTKYVKPAIDGGNDDAEGSSLATAYATIAYAVAQLGDDGGVVYLADGTYTEVKAADGDRSAVKLLTPVRVVGLSGNPTNVIVKTSSSASRIFELNHPDARLQYLTSSGGKVNNGGSVNIGPLGGVVEECIIEKGQNSDYAGGGGNLYMNGGRVSRCIIRNGSGSSNNSGRNGGGFWMDSGMIENCLITNNTGRYSGGVASGTAKIINCTIVNNTFNTAGYGAVYVPTKDADAAKVFVVNTIISGNKNSAGSTMADFVFSGNANCFVACASAEGRINDSCLTGDMGFQDAANGNYTLSARSQLRNKGVDTMAYGAVSRTDLAGGKRIVGKGIDLGCYEELASSLEVTGAPAEYGVANPAYGVNAGISGETTATVSKEVVTEDGRTRVTCTGWKLYQTNDEGVETFVCGGEGNEAKFTAPDCAARLTWEFVREFKMTAQTAAGLGSVSCDEWVLEGESFTPVVTPGDGWRFNAWIGDVSAGERKLATLLADRPRDLSATFLPNGVAEPVQYVTLDGDDSRDGWTGTASRKTIAAAVATIAQYGDLGGEVRVARGTYTSTGCVTVDCAVRILGETGDPADVVLTKGDSAFRHFYINHPKALVANMTLEKGYVQQDQGANVKIGESGGVVSNCVMRQGRVYNYYGGALGVATVSMDALVTHCVICDNSSVDQDNEGAGAIAVLLKPGRMENSLICQNTSDKAKVGYAVVAVKKGGSVVNCMVVDNMTTVGVGIDSDKDSFVKNCVMYNNTNTNNSENVRVSAPWGGTSAAFGCCATDGEVDINETCKLITSAAFKDYANGDYRPAEGGALVDSGVTPEGWAGITDLAGKKRVVGSAIDIGCYELQKRGGIKLIFR